MYRATVPQMQNQAISNTMPIDYSRYHPQWKDLIRPDILKRDEFRCAFCGVEHKVKGYRQRDGTFVKCDENRLEWAAVNGFKVIRIILTVAHLDHDIKNNNYDNLKALCQRCHLNYDRKHKAWMRRLKMNDTQENKTPHTTA